MTTGRASLPALPRDRVALLLAVGLFSHGLGIGIVVVPLLALSVGYDAASVGFLVATAAGCQFLTRLALPALLGRFADRALAGAAALCLLGTFGLIALSTALPVFLLAQILQGIGRALFWTSTQTHAVRDTGRPVDRLVDMNLAGNLGTLTGPLVAGLLGAIDLRLALAAAVAVATTAAVLTLGLRRLPPFDRTASSGTLGLLRRPDVAASAWGCVVGGAWWGMLGSFVPVLLVGAGIGTLGVGGMVTTAEAAGFVSLLVLRRLPAERLRDAVRLGGFVVCAALVALALAPPLAALYVALLVVGGGASGAVTTLAPAQAASAAGPEEQGDALSLAGTFRAGALLGSPAGVGALVSFLPLAAGFLTLGLGLALVGGLVGRRATVSSTAAPGPGAG